METAFLRSIMARPHDADPRLIFADWLEERGDPRAEFHRLLAELEQLDAGKKRRYRQPLCQRVFRWLGQHADRFGPFQRVAGAGLLVKDGGLAALLFLHADALRDMGD